VVAAVVALGVVPASCGGSLEGKVGSELYEAACARCHGARGEGGIGPAIGTADSRAATELTDDQLNGVIRVGFGSMPSFPTLTEEQRASLVAELRRLQRSAP
jgi:mono/diheme cytochrome c family protein